MEAHEKTGSRKQTLAFMRQKTQVNVSRDQIANEVWTAYSDVGKIVADEVLPLRCLQTVVLATSLMSFLTLAHASTWAKKGTSFPATCFSDSIRECRSKHITSPDGQKFVEVGYEKVVLPDGGFIMSVGLDVVTKDGRRYGIRAGGLAEREVLWSPDSTALFINGSDGGEGPDHVFLYRVGERGSRPLNVLAVQKDMMESFPPCKAKDADPELCLSFSKHPEEINVSAIAWKDGSSAVVVLAEMPCSSAFGGIFCQVLGYEIEASSGRILRRMEAREFARRWRRGMAWKFHVPEPPEYETNRKPNSRLTSSLTPSGPIVIRHKNGVVIERLRITSTTGDCVQIIDSTNITVQNSEIGPCTGGSTANAISIVGGSGISIYDDYIHQTSVAAPCCDTHDGIHAIGGTTSVQHLTIQGNVIAYGESNIEIQDATNVTVVGNFLLNPINSDPTLGTHGQSRGQNFQCWRGGLSLGCRDVTFRNNYTLSSPDTNLYTYPEDQEDSINFGYTDGAVVQNNYITGGHSPSGCGLAADYAANRIRFQSNVVLNTGQCGIGIAAGTNIVDGNKVYNLNPIAGGGNTAIYTWSQYALSCGPTRISNNIADAIQPSGLHSGFWDGGGCSDTLTGNIFGPSADTLLTPSSAVFVPPLIPPEPKNCAVPSPYSTQTFWRPCLSASSAALAQADRNGWGW